MAPMNFDLPFRGSGVGEKTSAATDGRPLVFGIRPEDVYLAERRAGGGACP